MRLDSALKNVVPNISRPKKSRHFLMKLPDHFQMREHSRPCRFHINIWNAYNIYMNCHTYQHFHMFLFHTINGRIVSTLINTRVTSLYFRHIVLILPVRLLINHSYCAHTQRNLYKTIIKH